jgi:hypothetical protein
MPHRSNIRVTENVQKINIETTEKNGAQGIQGIGGDGRNGAQGPQGIAIQGAQGATGLGAQGIQGTTGIGTQGTQGLTGAGVQGTQGLQGVTGLGTQGITGVNAPVPDYDANMWATDQDYVVGQQVKFSDTSSGTLYVLYCNQNHHSDVIPFQTSYWLIIGASVQGTQGRQGTQGAQGRQGATSDIRLKKNIRPYEDRVQTVMGINPKVFQFNGLWETNDCGVDNVGLIANDLEKLIPQAIFRLKGKLRPTDEAETDILHYDLTGVVMALVNAVNEHTVTIDLIRNILEKHGIS